MTFNENDTALKQKITDIIHTSDGLVKTSKIISELNIPNTQRTEFRRFLRTMSKQGIIKIFSNKEVCMADKADEFSVFPLPDLQQIKQYIDKHEETLKIKQVMAYFALPISQKKTFVKHLRVLESQSDIVMLSNKEVQSAKANSKNTTDDVKTGKSPPSVAVLIVASIDSDGTALAYPEKMSHKKNQIANIIVTGQHSLKQGDAFLGKLSPDTENTTHYTAKVLSYIKKDTSMVMGVLESCKDGFILQSVDKKDRKDYFISTADATDCEAGDIVKANISNGRSLGMKKAKVSEKIGKQKDARSISVIAIHAHNIPNEFPEQVFAESDACCVPELGKRTDLRDIPLVTIDGETARDFDDAVYAEPLPDGNFKVCVAIADVAHYVTSNSAMDKEARLRGNSVYFTDRVVPMLPEFLSNGLCSLVPNEERACMAVWMTIDTNGKIKDFEFIRGLMKSYARLTYEQVQTARNGTPCSATKPVMTQINALYDVYDILSKATQQRGALNLDLPERQVVLSKDGYVESIFPKARLDSHKLIEELMICANVATAKALQKKKAPAIMYRVHDVPPLEKTEILTQSLEKLNIPFAKKGITTAKDFNVLLQKSKETEYANILSTLVLRSQSQAVYSPENLGHFGLALRDYCHFTSPIRRYSDLLVHRALISAHKLGDDGLQPYEIESFTDIAEEISTTERRAVKAERETLDRYLAAYLEKQVGATFTARISGITEFAIFLTLDETGADGVVFMKNLKNDFFQHDPNTHSASGRKTGLTYRIGDTVVAELLRVNPIKGGMEFIIVKGGTKGQPLKTKFKKTKKKYKSTK